MLAEPDLQYQQQLNGIKAMIIEDSFESRGLLKSQLKQFGIGSIEAYENGAQLLREQRTLDVDVLIIGFGLGYCHSGIELVQTLTSLKMLPVWCKVIFITNSDSLTSNSYPFRYLKCEVLRKPINPRTLKQLILEGCESIRQFKGIIEDLAKNKLQGLLIKLEGKPRGTLTPTQNDELSAITMHLMLRLGQGNKAWKLTNSISDEVFRVTNRLTIANVLGDERKLKMTIGMLQGTDSMRKRGIVYQISLYLREGNFSEAQDLIKSQGSHTLSLAEIELYALLTVEAVGLSKAVEFLTFKRGTSLENLFFRNSIRLIKIKCYLYTLLREPEITEEHEGMFFTIDSLLDKTSWGKGTVDFSPTVNYVRLLVHSLRPDQHQDVSDDFSQLIRQVGEAELLPLLLLTASSFLLDDKDTAKEYLLKADKAMLSLEVSPESLVNKMWFERVFNALFSEPERAREYNRIGIHHAQNDNPYQALNMFYHSHLCAPKHASIAINLLDALGKLGLETYWQTSQKTLSEEIANLRLRDIEQKKYQQLLKKLF